MSSDDTCYSIYRIMQVKLLTLGGAGLKKKIYFYDFHLKYLPKLGEVSLKSLSFLKCLIHRIVLIFLQIYSAKQA